MLRMKFKPPLKWPGGKYKVMPHLRKHLPKGKCLVEPFAGGGSVFMNTDYDRYVLCDSNAALINFYQRLTYNTTALIDRAWSLFRNGGTRKAYNQNCQAFNTLTLSHDLMRNQYLEWAALFLYLNRHSFNGLQRTNRKGEFNVQFGKRDLPYFPYVEMRLFAEKARNTMTRFICADFRSSIRNFPGYVPSDEVFIYCDPPYLPVNDKDSFTRYNGQTFTREDHRALAAYLVHTSELYGAKVVISNSDTPLTCEIYAPFTFHELEVRRSISASAKGRKKAAEVIGVLDDRERYASAPRRPGKATAAAQWEVAL
ncbi:Dam family site-specific DNA-(adenine-N6)-methyltransferase [Salmonella enterica subsp. enterica serovar Anatum]|nr:Dam family site-specific DNA-(adenine-N6)-methyltransferase [Salmonella enterica subsp. enterica serovar Anatum]